jgi:hypothetical protein
MQALLKTGFLAAIAAGTVFSGLAFGGDDTTPPELKSLSFTPESIDTSTRAVEVTISFSVTDDSSGANYFEAAFVDSSGAVRQAATARFAPTLSATHSVRVAFPRFSNSGTWTLANVFLSDAAGNTLVLDADGIRRRGYRCQLEVQSARDTVSPRLASLDFSPSEIDTSAGPADVKVNFTVTDDLSGVSFLELSFISPSGVARRGGTAKFDAAQSISNAMTVTFPRLSEPGQWTLSALFLADAAGNTLVLDAEGIVRAGLRTNLNVKSASDTVPPKLTALHFAPEAIDTSRGPVTVKVEFTATDNFSGVKHLEVVFVSPSGAAKQSASAVFRPATEVAGSLDVNFPQSSEPGAWTVGMVIVTDDAGNTLVLDADALASRLYKALQVR